ncbi:hypothetical protein ISN44_As13g006650 [Arabidopsis suecica]|uniref:Uncharacterized protein n=1 Tax=Arabidopsis suecica TaxID=45249 RepID=A0A8T1XVG6_ARASU|nr:hypothetical protein ISN44_As13g006650 [Arabidopsis suecica]
MASSRSVPPPSTIWKSRCQYSKSTLISGDDKSSEASPCVSSSSSDFYHAFVLRKDLVMGKGKNLKLNCIQCNSLFVVW